LAFLISENGKGKTTIYIYFQAKATSKDVEAYVLMLEHGGFV